MSFTLPQALVLLLPLGLFLWKRGQRPGPPMVLRWALLLLVIWAALVFRFQRGVVEHAHSIASRKDPS